MIISKKTRRDWLRLKQNYVDKIDSNQMKMHSTTSNATISNYVVDKLIIGIYM